MAETKIISKRPQEEELDTLVRILGYDIPGSKNLYVGLTKIKGVSWTVSNAVCVKLNFPRSKKIAELSKEEIHKIEEFIRALTIPDFLKNRRFDLETGETKHFIGTDLDMKREFDIKRLIKMKSYVGIRHASGQPVRGQSTRSHFRKREHKKSTGIKKDGVVIKKEGATKKIEKDKGDKKK